MLLAEYSLLDANYTSLRFSLSHDNDCYGSVITEPTLSTQTSYDLTQAPLVVSLWQVPYKLCVHENGMTAPIIVATTTPMTLQAPPPRIHRLWNYETGFHRQRLTGGHHRKPTRMETEYIFRDVLINSIRQRISKPTTGAHCNIFTELNSGTESVERSSSSSAQNKYKSETWSENMAKAKAISSST